MAVVTAVFVCIFMVFLLAASFAIKTKELLLRVLRRKKGGEGDG